MMPGSGQEGGKALRLNGGSRFWHAKVFIEDEASHPPHEQQESSRGRMLETQKKPNEVKRQ